MSRTRIVSTALAATLMLGLLSAPGASANSFLDIYQAYATTGKIDACKFTSKQLADAKNQVPGDISQYAPDFPDALDAAAQQRASGGCNKKASSSTTGAAAATTTGSAGTPAATTAVTTAPTTAVTPTTAAVAPIVTAPPVATVSDAALASSADNGSGNDSTPAALVVLAILGAMALIAVTTVGAARWWAFDPPWLARTRHSVSEAGWRASAAWAEFTDWVRFGR